VSRLAIMGRIAFAAVAIVYGIAAFAWPEFGPIWQAHGALVYVCAVVSIACGIGLLVPRLAPWPARAWFGYLALWMIVFRGRDIVRAPGAFGSYDNCAETLALVAAAWVLTGWRVPVAQRVWGVAMIPFGLAHLIYPDETAQLVPSWLPAHQPLAYATGIAFLLAGAAILAGIRARLAATLSAIQIGLFTLLVWVPTVAQGATSAFVWHELGISVALTVAGAIIASSYVRSYSSRP
jgi:uncharacterized membrane protein